MSESNQTTSQLLCWNSKAESSIGNAYALMERSLKLKLDAGEWPCSYILDRTDDRCQKMKVLKLLVIPTGIEVGDHAEAKVAMFKLQSEERTRVRKLAFDWNKRRIALHVKATAVAMSLFDGDCIAASVMTNAINPDKDEVENFYGVLAALEKAFKPNTTTDALKYREQLSACVDKGMKHSGWHAKWNMIYAQLFRLKAMPSMAELNQIMIRVVQNPSFASSKSKLIVDSAKTYAHDDDRVYTYMDFMEEALTISQTLELAENWGIQGESAMAVAGGVEGGVFTGCYRCAGPHQVRACGSKVCTKCGAKILGEDGKRIRHEARYCTGGGPPAGNASQSKFSKGGDKGGDGGKPKGSWEGKKNSSKGSKSPGGASESSSLPDPSLLKSKTLKAFTAKASQVLKSRDGGTKRKYEEFESYDDWKAAEPKG
jgi:hypothetical protein